MKDTLDRKPRILVWAEAGFATAPDGYVYGIFDDWSRGEPRIYWPMVHSPGETFAPRWKSIPFEASRSRDTAMNAAERHAREHHAGEPS